MPSFELNKLQAVSGIRGLAETDDRSIEARSPRTSGPPTAAAAPASGGVSIEVGSGLDASTPPVDSDRVSEIRNALRDGNYPLVPTKIADAMITAQLRPIVGE